MARRLVLVTAPTPELPTMKLYLLFIKANYWKKAPPIENTHPEMQKD